MDDIDRTSDSYRLKKSLLQRAWRSSNPEKAPELIAMINNASKWRRDLSAAEEGALIRRNEELIQENEDRDLVERIRRARSVGAEDVSVVLQDIKETKQLLLATNADRFPVDRSGEKERLIYNDDSAEYKYYVETEMHNEMDFRTYLLNARICTAGGLPVLSFGTIRMNAAERMKADKDPENYTARFWSNEDYKPFLKLREDYFSRQKEDPPRPSYH